MFQNQINSVQETPCKKVLIIQLARIGDILQTCTAVERAKIKNPNTAFYFLGRSKFSSGLSFLLQPIFAETFELPPSRDFLSSQNIDLESFKSFLDRVNSFEFDEVVNLTFSNTASVLAAVINSKIKKGIYRDKTGIQVFSDPWTCYVHSTVLTGANNLLNLVDLFVGIITGSISGAEIEIGEYVIPADKHLFIHPFASHSKKFWSPDRWCEFFFKLLRDAPDITIHLLGAPAEMLASLKMLDHPLMKSFSHRLVSHVGKMQISEILELCKEASLFIGHDSMIGHLVSRSNIPSITVALGQVRAEETIPYSPYALTVSPRTKCFPCLVNKNCGFYQCHYDLTVNSLAGFVRDFFQDTNIFTASTGWNISSVLNDCNVNVAVSDLKHGWDFVCQKKRGALSFEEVLRIFYRMTFLKIIDDIDVIDKFPSIFPEEIQQYLEYKTTLQKALELITFGEIFSNQILMELCKPAPSSVALQPLAQKIQEIEGLLLMLTNSRQGLTPLTHYITSSYSSRPDDTIITQANITMNAFIEGKLLCRVLLELTEEIIASYAKSQLELEK